MQVRRAVIAPMQRVNLLPTVMPPPQTRFELSIEIAPVATGRGIKGFQVDLEDTCLNGAID